MQQKWRPRRISQTHSGKPLGRPAAHTDEKYFLYLIVHNVVEMNRIKSLYGYTNNLPLNKLSNNHSIVVCGSLVAPEQAPSSCVASKAPHEQALSRMM